MTLSNNAIKDLRIALSKTYGEAFAIALSDEEIKNIGVLILTGLTESLKMEIVSPELPTIRA
jgi:hypothetical protein